MKMPVTIRISPPSDHFSEITVLAVIAVGVIWLANGAIKGNDAGEASAWTAVLMAIISAIKDRWSQRSVDRMGQSLANAPAADPPAQEPK